MHWYSSTSCIARIVQNEEVLREIFCDGIALARYGDAVIMLNRIQVILADGSFWMNARQY
ncbi:Hypothetical protein PHPALM_16772 [Phytophthora palmivora]|uniref:Uncharacterized protein n=1 Tax=Phytophthora palmivora TaxID=4796 RepID=A0A2P4XNZ0_9STRA|nr:Hypothetical protein PHPALM_16772 [Phytophthora palmivora]